MAPRSGRIFWLLVATALAMLAAQVHAATAQKWVTVWAGSVQGPYPIGNPSAQPDQRFAFPSAESGARDQTFRLIVRPDIWGPQARIRLTNALGMRPVTFDNIYAGLQLGGPALVRGSNRRVKFAGKEQLTLAPGQSAWSDPIAMPYTQKTGAQLPANNKLAISFHIVGESGPMTWHAKALTTSFVSSPGSGAKGHDESESAFPFSTASWFFLDAVDMMAPATTKVIVAFGDSITDGTASTMNGDDRWADVLSRRLHAVYGDRVSVVMAAIGGNQVIGPAEYSLQKPFAGGPSAKDRLERDVLSLSGVSGFIFLEGINDFSKNGNASAENVQAGMKEIVRRLREKLPGIRVLGATVTSALGSSSAAHGSPEQDAKRKALNDYIRSSGLFDAVLDFDAATLDRDTGGMRAEFVPESTTGGPGDRLHPNRAGYLSMGSSIDLKLLGIK
jgi:lysophospholipase L1-like esterase